MRYGVLADIHGNMRALRVALETLEREGVDRYLVAGDVVGYGPEPNECVEAVASLDCVCVAGNHDLIAIGRLSDERCESLAQHSLRWTRRVLSEEARKVLGGLPLQATTDDGVVIAHGSLHDPQEYTTRPAQASDQLTRMTEELRGSRILVLGHTHRPWAFARRSGSLSTRGELVLPDEAVHLNPGSVGQSRELRVRARCLLLELDENSATFFAPAYDVAGCRAALRHHGLSPRSHHIRPSVLGIGRRTLRRMANALTSR